ncbi:AAA family ATPase [Streptomyces sp. NPDC048550]|uniref:AAA family ATPase n=1 Tax=Streptomyces sp. NPDC048550 TaxID=3155739 RepID=UPI003422C7AC
MTVWLNGTHGAGKTTTSALVQQLIPDSQVFDAEKVGETLMDITPGLPATDNFQHWPPWRPLVVETARRVLDYTGGTLVMPMTVLVERYWREISSGHAQHDIPVRHFVLHADQDTLRARIAGDTVLGPNSPFRLQYLEPYAEAALAPDTGSNLVSVGDGLEAVHEHAELTRWSPARQGEARLSRRSAARSVRLQ